jgi:hypothetical protein
MQFSINPPTITGRRDAFSVSSLRRIFSFLTAALVCLALIPGRALAQYENGSIVGSVHDSSGAVVSDATVKVTNIATGVVSTRQTNDSGDYEVPALRVGQYNVEISKSGFAPTQATNITVSVAARQRIDLTLKVGETSTTVEVSGVSLQVETDTSQRGQIVTQYQTAALPLVSRNYSDLIGLTTGVRQTTQSYSSTSNTGLVREGSFNVNGQRSIFNNFLLDGMDNNAYGESNQGFSNQIIQPAPDSIAQFQVVTNNETAEYGRASGAVVNVAFAQGTNQFHGRVYEFIRNTDLNATGFFRPPGGQKPAYNRNQFGGNIGGPIVKDHLFFFLDYEGFRQSRKQISSATLPTPTELAGKFGKTVYSPYDGTAYAAGTSILNDSHISPAARTINGLIAGLNPSSATTNNFTTLQRSNNRSDKGDLRLDWTPNQKNSFFLRVSDLKQNATDFPIFGLPLDGQSNGDQRILDQQIALGYTRVIGANQLLDARLGLSRTKAGKFSRSIGTNPGFSFPGLPTDPIVTGGIPGIGISGFSALGRQVTNPQFQNPALLNPKVNYSWVIKNHSLKVGYEYQQVWMAVQDTNPLYGGFTYAGGYSRNYTGGKTTESATNDNYYADFLWGATSSYSLSSYFVAHLRNRSNFAYVQDDWKVSPKLTLNLGVRYEYTTPYWEQKNLQSNFDPSLANSSDPRNAIVPVSASGNKYGYDPDRNDFAPRIGFAYAADDKTAIRGGYGISYSHYDRAGSGNILAINPPEALFVTVSQAAPNAGGKGQYTPMDQGFPSNTLTFDPKTDNIAYIDSNRYRDSYVHNYYLDVQRTLAKNILLDVAYVGNHGLKLLQFANFNQADPKVITNNQFTRPIPTYGDITIALHQAYSNYNGLQVRYEQRMVGGLTLLNSFTWSHTLDNSGASLEANTPSLQDYRNPAADYSQSEYNQPIVNTTSLVYELPFGRGRHWLNEGGIVNQVLGQWQVSAVNQATSGFPYQITYTPPTGNQVSGIAASYRGQNLYRPNRISGVKLNSLDKSKSTGTSLQYINMAAIAIPTSTPTVNGIPVSPFGNMARDPGRSPAYNSLNIAMNKRFDTPLESLKVEFRGELYNAFNHTNFPQPGGGISVSSTGTLSGGTITSTLDPRIIQFGLKVLF